MSRRLLKMLNESTKQLPANKKFANDLMKVIEQVDMKNAYKGSNYYKPSSLACKRQMYFTRTKAEQDTTLPEYQMVGMAQTGTDRHERIQKALLQMKQLGYDWEYVDVAEYVKMKQAQGKCKELKVTGTKGVETHLFHKGLKLSFLCDGIIKQLSTGEYFLFEFKNVVSFKFNRLTDKALEQHLRQVTCYCLCLDLDKVFLTYENRDTCNLEVPELVEITNEMKQDIVSLLLHCEQCVEQQQLPEKVNDTKVCRYCRFKKACKKAGD